jgi:hypothetical protein
MLVLGNLVILVVVCGCIYACDGLDRASSSSDPHRRGGTYPYNNRDYRRQPQGRFDQEDAILSRKSSYGGEGGGDDFNSDQDGARDRDGRSRDSRNSRDSRENTASKYEGDATPTYMKNILGVLGISLITYMTSSMLWLFLLRLLFSKMPMKVALVLGISNFIACFFPNGDYVHFSKSLGVGTILFLRRLRPGHFLVYFFRQLKAFMMLSARQPFPPTENPWQSHEALDASLVPYSMMNTVISVLVTSMLVVYHIGKRIPFFPALLVALGVSIFNAYLSTTRNARGDMLRYCGHSMCVLTSHVLNSAEDVYLQEKFSTMMMSTFSFLKFLDNQYHIMGYFRFFLGRLKSFVGTIQRDMSDRGGGSNNDNGNYRDGDRDRYDDGNNRNRPYGQGQGRYDNYRS